MENLVCAVQAQCVKMTKSAKEPELYAHFHETIEALCVQSGSLVLWLNDSQLDLKEGELVIISSNEPHRIESHSPESEYYSFGFSPRLLYSFEKSPDTAKYILPFFSKSRAPRIYPKSFSDAAELFRLFADAESEYGAKTAGYELALKADALRLLRAAVAYLSRLGLYSQPCAPACGMQEIMPDVLEYINRGFVGVSEKAAAESFGVSYSYFSRSFKSIMGMSFKEYVNYLKINEAQRMLIQTDKSITDIAMELGFSSSSHFINSFRKLNGCPPRQYKQKLQSGK